MAADRYDRLHAPRYDESWGEVFLTQRAFVDRLLAMTPPGGLVVDVACGTGKYWPQILAAGHRLLGVDQSSGMLAIAHQKYPQVETRTLAMQELKGQADLAGVADVLLCVDALENVGPEDWPGVVAGLSTMLRPSAPAYVTVELPDQPLPDLSTRGRYRASRSGTATTTTRSGRKSGGGWPMGVWRLWRRPTPTTTGT